MKFYSFGKQEKPTLFLLPGTCCHWKRNFEMVIPLLEREFRVVCVSYDGFDETEQTVFPDMLTESVKIENYIQENFGGHIRAAYGCSMGGSFVGLLLQRGNIQIDHAILGSSDLDQNDGLSARLQAKLVSYMLYHIFQKGKLPGWMQKSLWKKTPEERAYMDRMMEMFGVGSTDMGFVRRESIFNQFYSDLVTPLETGISVPGTTVHIFYAVKMGKQYESRYHQHFKVPDIRRHEMQHEELLVCYPQKWTDEVCSCCEVEKEYCKILSQCHAQGPGELWPLSIYIFHGRAIWRSVDAIYGKGYRRGR